MKLMIDKIKNKYISIPVQARASLWFLMCSILQRGISVLTTPIFTRLLSTSEYGQYNVFNSWLNVITVFVTLRMYNAVYTQGLVKFNKERDVFSSSLQGLTLVLVTGWLVFYLFTQNLWNTLTGFTTVQMLAMFVMIWTTSIFSFWAAEQRVKLQYKNLIILTIIVSIAKPLICILLIRSATDKVTARILGLMIVEVIGYTGLFFVQLKKGRKFYSKRFWKYSLAFCLPLVPHYLSQTILNSADKIMIEKMVGDSEAGIYSLAYSLAQLMLMVNQALLQTVNPWIYQKIKDRREMEISKVALPCLAIIGVMNIILICFAPEIVSVFAPDTYKDAVWIIPPVAMSGYFIFAYSLFADFEFYYEKKKYIAVATAISAGLNIILNYIFIKIFGYYAAGYTTLVCYMLYTLGHYFCMNKILRENSNGIDVYNKKALVTMTGGFLLVGFLMLVTYRYMIIRYSCIVVLFIVLFVYRNKIVGVVKKILSTKN